MDFIDALEKANIEIYELLKQNGDKLKEKLTKGFGGDISTKADMEAEAIFVRYLKNFGSIFSEESGLIEGGEEIIYVDPLDGSDNFLSNIPYFGSSIAKVKNGEVTHAAVANFATATLRVKTKDEFYQLCMKSGKKSEIVPNPYSNTGIYERSYADKNMHDFLKNEGLKYRSPGALALSLSLANEVNFVLYMGSVREFDVAAGWEMSRNLYSYRDEKTLLVSKDKGIFDKIYDFIKEQSVNGIF